MGWIWALFFVVTAACLAVIVTLLWKTYKRVRSLGSTVAEASRRIAEASAALEEIKPAPRD